MLTWFRLLRPQNDGTRGERDDPLGQPYTVIYDTYGHPSRTVDEVGHETQSLFDSRGRALKYVYPEGDCEVFGYDNRNNTAELYRIDKTSSCSTAAGATHVLHAVATWDPDWNKPRTVTNFRGKVTTLEYYPSGTNASLLKTATRPAIAEGTPVYKFEYDGKGKLTKSSVGSDTTPLVTTQYVNDPANENLLQTILDPGTGKLNLTTAFGYDAAGNVTTTTDPKGSVTTAHYDANRNKDEEYHHDGDATKPLNAASKTVFDEINRAEEEDAAKCFDTASPCLDHGTVVATWLAVKKTTYTPTSKVATVTDADSRTTTTSYDDGDRVLTVTDPVGRKLHYRYCGAAVADCAANAVRTEYRGWQSGNACSVSGTDQQCYRRPAYTPNGRQKTLKDANGNTTSYTYDGFDRLTRTTFPDATYEQLTLDENGNVTARRNRAGQTLTYTYNDLDWLAEKVSPSPAVTTDWTYLLDGRIDLLSDTAANTIDYGYDTAGRLNQVVTTVPGLAAKTVGYGLDENGNRTKLTWPDGYYVGYCYDSLNRMTDAGENATDCTSNPLAHYTYDPQSRRSALAYVGSAGASVAYSYSDAGDLLTLNHAMVGTGDPGYVFTYTNAHQLESETQSNNVYVWQPSTTGTTSYGAANDLNQYPTVAGLTQSHDANGNLTGDGTTSFTYDAENRLLTASRTGLAASYQYDPLGRRTRKSGTGTVPAVFLSDGADEIAEYDATTGALTNRYIPGPGIDQTIAMIQVPASGPVTKWFFHTNKQGSLIAATDETGARTAGPYIYDPSGNCFKGSLPCTTSTLTTIPFKYTGRRLDPETGLYYYRARYYDPITGRFLQVDPVGYDADLNLYTYVGNDPTNLTDPLGLYQYACETGSRIGCAQGFQTNQEKATIKLQNASERLGNAIKDIKAVAAAQAAGNTTAAVSSATVATERAFTGVFGQQTDMAGAMSTVQSGLDAAIAGLSGNNPASNASGSTMTLLQSRSAPIGSVADSHQLQINPAGWNAITGRQQQWSLGHDALHAEASWHDYIGLNGEKYYRWQQGGNSPLNVPGPANLTNPESAMCFVFGGC